MRLHTLVPLDDWSAVAGIARAAEEAGFDGLVSSEIANDPFIPLALAAQATARIELGTAIVVAFPRSPMVVANTAWDLHVQSGGRFVLGLGSQVKGHNERRFSVPWSPPVPRLREYVQSLYAIWRCWEKKVPLRYEGEHYRFTLMTPEFSPPPCELPRIPVQIAGVGPAMIKLAGRHCDGVRLHGFCTREYLEKVAAPAFEAGLAEAGRDRTRFEVWGGGFIATGRTEDEVRTAMDQVRYRIAFYGSTRSYRPVLSLHGWDDLGDKLHRMSLRGEWERMAGEVSDEVVHTFAACGTLDDLPRQIERRYGGLSDTVGLTFPPGTSPGRIRELVQDIQDIDSPFSGFATSWD
jgi:probable F420-dependent oxidoreductase